MRSKFKWILSLLLTLSMHFAFAQERIITGAISDASGVLPGVNILIKGSKIGVQSTVDGTFSIKAKTGDTLVFSFVGMETKAVVVSSSNVLNVKLEQSGKALQEVVITGYSTVSKKKSNIAQVKVSAANIENRPNASLIQTLSGQVAGLDISTNSGQPGANSRVVLRGANSIGGSVEPLFLLDGIPINGDNFRSLNPNEIESVTTLKDAGATAIYGNRGANGVVYIKTKSGVKNSGLQVSYTGITGFSSLQVNNKRGYNLFENSQDLLRFERTSGFGRGAGAALGPVFPANGAPAVPLTDAQIASQSNTDWLKFFLGTGITHNHTLTFSNGGENSSSFTSLGYFKQEGILRNSDLQRFNLRNNISGSSVNKKLTYTTSLSVNYSKDNEPTSIGTDGANQNPLFGAFNSLPYLTPNDNPGSAILAQSFILGYAPFYTIDKLSTSVALEEEAKIIAGFTASYKFTKDLTATVNSGLDYEHVTFLDFQNPFSRNEIRFSPGVDGTQSQYSLRRFTFNNTTSLAYNKTLEKHTFGASAYVEYNKNHLRTFGYTQNGLDPKTLSPGDGSGFIGDNGLNDLFVPTVNADVIDTGLFSYFGTLNYDFDSRFGVNGTIRRDASSRFAKTNRWGTFWSVAGFWNIADESFIKGSVFNILKLRGSYGTTGNQNIIATGEANQAFVGPDLPETFFLTANGYGNVASIQRGQIGNTSLKWEIVNQANVGIDFGVWNNRLRGAFDVYYKQTEGLYQAKPQSFVTGTNGAIPSNTGSLYNRGFDYELHYDVVNKSDFKFILNFVGNYNRSELADLPNTSGEIIGTGRNGGVLRERKLVRYAGVNPANGNILYLDVNNNVTERPNVDRDAVWTGTTNNPDFLGSLGFNLDYKGFFLTTQFNYETGITRFDFDYGSFINPLNIGQYNVSQDLLRAWTPNNTITDIPSVKATNLNVIGAGASDRFVKKADFLRLRFLQLGYNLPNDALKNTGFRNVRIFGNAENLFTWTEFRGFDPSSRAGSREYPTPKIISIGLEIGF
jgi:TonB-linked SusC/RagA family outer membrane protein